MSALCHKGRASEQGNHIKAGGAEPIKHGRGNCGNAEGGMLTSQVQRVVGEASGLGKSS